MASFLRTCALLCVLVCSLASAELTEECLGCMCVASSGCVMPDPPCRTESWGTVCSPWGFTEPYWIDGGRNGDSLEECSADWDCSELTVRSYLDRYVTSSTATCETYARTHAGGPWGAGEDYTLDYWYSVEDCLEDGGFTLPPQ